MFSSPWRLTPRGFAPELHPLPIPATTAPETMTPELAASGEAEPATASTAVASAIHPQPPMPSNHATTDRASAQLTLSFEIASLQLTPFFRIGSIRLKALSNVVSLHLVAAGEASDPFAAAISFQIEHVELDGNAHLRSLLLKPLGEFREAATPLPKLQTGQVSLRSDDADAPISVTTSEQVSTVVQLVGTFTVAELDFTPAFEIGSLRLEPTSQTVLARVVPSARAATRDLPPSFEIAEIQIDDAAQIVGARLTPTVARNA